MYIVHNTTGKPNMFAYLYVHHQRFMRSQLCSSQHNDFNDWAQLLLQGLTRAELRQLNSLFITIQG